MKKINSFLVIVIWGTLLGPGTFHLIKINPLFEELSILIIWIYLVLYLFILVVINMISVLLGAFMAQIVGGIRIKYIIAYPFCRDTKWLFKPYKMILNYECMNDGLLANLVLDIKKGHSEKIVYDKFRTLIHIRDSTIFLSSIVVFMSLSYLFSMSFLLEFSVTYIGYISLTFLSYDSYGGTWNGSRYMLKNQLLYNFLYRLPNLKDLTVKDYGEFLLNNFKKDSFSKYENIDILENYLFACVAEEKIYLTENELNCLYKTIFGNFNFMEFQSVKFNVQKNSQIKLIGIISKYVLHEPYQDIFEEEMYSYLLELSKADCFYRLRNDLKLFMDFIAGDLDNINLKKHVIINVRDYMYHRRSIEKKLKKWCLPSENKYGKEVKNGENSSIKK